MTRAESADLILRIFSGAVRLAHPRHHAFHAAHHFAEAAFAKGFHHLLRLLELVEQAVDVLDLDA